MGLFGQEGVQIGPRSFFAANPPAGGAYGKQSLELLHPFLAFAQRAPKEVKTDRDEHQEDENVNESVNNHPTVQIGVS